MDIKKLPEVTSKHIFVTNRMNVIDQNGLLSEKIFGPISSYRCTCGMLTKSFDKGKRCSRCGVECISSKERYHRFAKIKVPFPVYKNTHHVRALLNKLVKKNNQLLDPHQSDLNCTQYKFLRVSPKNRDELSIVDRESFDIDCIPIRITGIYSLYVALRSASKFWNSNKAGTLVKECFTTNVLVTPPNARFMFVSNTGTNRNVIRNPINTLYQQILRLCEYDAQEKSLLSKNIDDCIIMVYGKIKEQSEILAQSSDDTGDKNISHIFLNEDLIITKDQLCCKYQHYVNDLYAQIIAKLSGKEGLIRKDLLGRTVDFAARSHVVCDPTLSVYEIIIPRKIFIRLWFIEYLHYMKEYRNITPYNLKDFIRKPDETQFIYDDETVDEFITWFFNDLSVKESDKLVFINRQPTLWRYGIPVVQVVGVTDKTVIGVSPLFVEPLNMDFDGDCISHPLIVILMIIIS